MIRTKVFCTLESNLISSQDLILFSWWIISNFLLENWNEEHDFELSSEMRLCISLKVGREWKRFARNFDIEDEVIDDIDEDGDLPTLQDKCHQVFKKLEEDKVVKWNLVKEALDEIGKRNIITEFEKKF